MDSADKLTLVLVLVDIAVIVMAGLAGFLLDMALPGRRWGRWRVSARSFLLLCTCVCGVAGMIVLPLSMLVGVPGTFVATAGMGPWILALAGAICFAVSRRFDNAATGPGRRPDGTARW